MSKITKHKYYEFMCVLHDMKEFDIQEMRIHHKVGTRIITLMREHRMIKRYGNVTRWIGDKPTQAIANSFTKDCLKQSRIDNAQSKAGENQMTIQPLKRVERIAPVRYPVHEAEEQHTPYPIMDVVIAFLGGMIAAGFVSLIWK